MSGTEPGMCACVIDRKENQAGRPLDVFLNDILEQTIYYPTAHRADGTGFTRQGKQSDDSRSALVPRQFN